MAEAILDENRTASMENREGIVVTSSISERGISGISAAMAGILPAIALREAVTKQQDRIASFSTRLFFIFIPSLHAKYKRNSVVFEIVIKYIYIF